MPQFFKQIIGVMLLVIFCTSCGCATLFNSVSFKSAPRDSFVKVEVITEEHSGTGSGVIINHIDKSNTIILTAGHICHDTTIKMRILDLNEKPFEIIGFVTAKNDDLCLLITNGIVDGKSVKIAKNAPEIGDHTYNIAAPMGIHAPNMSLMFDGYYQGDIQIPLEPYPLSVYSIAGMGGSSGSPIFNDDWELVGIISLGMPKFQHIMISVEHSRVKKYYDYSFSKEFRIDAANSMGNIAKRASDYFKKILKQMQF